MASRLAASRPSRRPRPGTSTWGEAGPAPAPALSTACWRRRRSLPPSITSRKGASCRAMACWMTRSPSLHGPGVCRGVFWGWGGERERERWVGRGAALTGRLVCIRRHQSQYAWPAHHPHNPSTTNTPNQHQTVIIITVTRLLSLGTKFLKQPRVIMEVVGGILLGACVFGWLVGWLVGCFTHAGGWMRTKDGIGIPLASHDKAHNTRPHQPTHSLTD